MKISYIRKLRCAPDNKVEVIEISAPIRFYWKEDGRFEGIDVGPVDGISIYQMRLLHKVMKQIETLMQNNSSKIDDIPRVFINAFEAGEKRSQ